MNKSTKQWISAIVINVTFIAFMITIAFSAEGRMSWWIPALLLTVGLAIEKFLKMIFGPDAIYYQWREEGYEDKKTWIMKSDSLAAKLIRNRQSISLITMPIGLIFGLIIYLLLK